MIALLRRLLSREGLRSELKQMRANRDYWRSEAIRLAEGAAMRARLDAEDRCLIPPGGKP